MGVMQQDLTPRRASGLSLYPGLCTWHGQDVRVIGVNIPEKYNLALEDTVGSCAISLNTFCVLGSVLSNL